VGVDFSNPPVAARQDEIKRTIQDEESQTEPAEISTTTNSSPAVLLGDPLLWLCAFVFFFYSPLEATVGAWATTYLGDKGLPVGTAAGVLSAYWLSAMATQLLTAFCLPAGWESLLLLALSGACVWVLIGIVWSRRRGVAVALVIGAGLVFGPIMPTNMAVLLGHFDQSFHGRAVGLLFAVGGLGWTTVPLLMGAYARRTSVQQSFLIAAGSAVGLCGMTLALWMLL
jgi:fucose permease